MTYIMVDVEADGPCPGIYSMIAVGAVVVDRSLSKRYLAYLQPISDRWNEDALRVSGFNREDCFGDQFRDATVVMADFHKWIAKSVNDRPMFISDNNGFDWQFVNYYFWSLIGNNPFGHSSTNLGSLYKGLNQNLRANFKKLRKTKHDHNPLNDALGNAEAMLEILERYNLHE